MIYVAAASYIFQNEDKFFFKHQELSSDFQYTLNTDFQELNIPLNKDAHLHALWLQHNNKKGMILYFPDGNYESGQLSNSQKFYFQLGYDLIIPDYRGNGKSTGKYHLEEDIYQDAQQWMKMTLSIADSLPVVLVGQEFGSGIAAKVAKSSQAKLLILEKPYRAWNEVMLRKYFWWLPHTYFTQYKIPTWKFIRATSIPIVLIHSTDSKNIKFKNSEILLQYFKPGDILISPQGETIDYQSKEFLNKFNQIKLP